MPQVWKSSSYLSCASFRVLYLLLLTDSLTFSLSVCISGPAKVSQAYKSCTMHLYADSGWSRCRHEVLELD